MQHCWPAPPNIVVSCCVCLHVALSMLRHNESYRGSDSFTLNQKDILIFLKNLLSTKPTVSVDTILYHKLFRSFLPFFFSAQHFYLWYKDKNKVWGKSIHYWKLEITKGCGVQENDARWKRFNSSVVLCASFTWWMVQTNVIIFRVTEDPNASDQIAFFEFHSFLVQTNAGYIHAMHA